ncbi:MAG: hypothetical protein ABI599_07565 [Flavobacteriales bacterium]
MEVVPAAFRAIHESLTTLSPIQSERNKLLVGWDSRDDGDFHLDGFLCVDEHSTIEWIAAQNLIHERILRDSRTVKYSELRPSAVRTQQALAPTLESAGNLKGVLVVVATDKAYLREDGIILRKSISNEDWIKLTHTWTENQLDRALRISILHSIICSRVSSQGTNIDTLLDEDEIVQKEGQGKDLAKIMDFFIQQVSPHKLGTCRVTRDKHEPHGKDFTTIADLAVGATFEYLKEVKSQAWPIKIDWATRPQKSKFIADWWKVDGQPLQKILLLANREESGSYTAQQLKLSPSA